MDLVIFSPKTAWKWKKLEWRRASLATPLYPPVVISIEFTPPMWWLPFKKNEWETQYKGSGGTEKTTYRLLKRLFERSKLQEV